MLVIIKKKFSFETIELTNVKSIELDTANNRYTVTTADNVVYSYPTENYYTPMIMMMDI